MKRKEGPGSPGQSLPVSDFIVSHTTAAGCSQARPGSRGPDADLGSVSSCVYCVFVCR